MKNKKLVLLSLVAVPSLLYSAPASATEISKPAYILASYNANVANVVQLINNINNTTATFQTNLEADFEGLQCFNGNRKTVCYELLHIVSTSADKNLS